MIDDFFVNCQGASLDIVPLQIKAIWLQNGYFRLRCPSVPLETVAFHYESIPRDFTVGQETSTYYIQTAPQVDHAAILARRMRAKSTCYKLPFICRDVVHFTRFRDNLRCSVRKGTTDNSSTSNENSATRSRTASTVPSQLQVRYLLPQLCSAVKSDSVSNGSQNVSVPQPTSDIQLAIQPWSKAYISVPTTTVSLSVGVGCLFSPSRPDLNPIEAH